MNISIRKFTADDIPNKVEWINNPHNNKYLHYDIPLEINKTKVWFENIKESSSRYDGVIVADNRPVGLIGLLSIDNKVKKAEYYICLNHEDTGKGIAGTATHKLLNYAFEELKLNKVYLFTEENNIPAQKLFRKIGFVTEGILRDDTINNGKFVNRYVMSILRTEYEGKQDD